jgi:hypothetical protein
MIRSPAYSVAHIPKEHKPNGEYDMEYLKFQLQMDMECDRYKIYQFLKLDYPVKLVDLRLDIGE